MEGKIKIIIFIITIYFRKNKLESNHIKPKDTIYLDLLSIEIRSKCSKDLAKFFLDCKGQ